MLFNDNSDLMYVSMLWFSLFVNSET